MKSIAKDFKNTNFLSLATNVSVKLSVSFVSPATKTKIHQIRESQDLWVCWMRISIGHSTLLVSKRLSRANKPVLPKWNTVFELSLPPPKKKTRDLLSTLCACLSPDFFFGGGGQAWKADKVVHLDKRKPPGMFDALQSRHKLLPSEQIPFPFGKSEEGVANSGIDVRWGERQSRAQCDRWSDWQFARPERKKYFQSILLVLAFFSLAFGRSIQSHKRAHLKKREKSRKLTWKRDVHTVCAWSAVCCVTRKSRWTEPLCAQFIATTTELIWSELKSSHVSLEAQIKGKSLAHAKWEHELFAQDACKQDDSFESLEAHCTGRENSCLCWSCRWFKKQFTRFPWRFHHPLFVNFESRTQSQLFWIEPCNFIFIAHNRNRLRQRCETLHDLRHSCIHINILYTPPAKTNFFFSEGVVFSGVCLFFF